MQFNKLEFLLAEKGSLAVVVVLVVLVVPVAPVDYD